MNVHGYCLFWVFYSESTSLRLRYYALSFGPGMGATLRAFRAEHYLWRSDWLKLHGWLAARTPLLNSQLQQNRWSARLERLKTNSLLVCHIAWYSQVVQLHHLQYQRALLLHVVGMLWSCLWHKLTELVHSLPVSASVLTALSTVFHFINSPDNSPFLHSVLRVLFPTYWSFQLYISLRKSPSALI